MPLGYHIDADAGLITVRGDGDVAVTDIVRLGETMLRDQRYEASLPQLLDFRGLRPTGPAPARNDEEFADLLQFVNGHYRKSVDASVAVVIDDHLEERHCADIFLLTCAISEAELFADYDQALKWLMREAFATSPADLGLHEQEYAQTDGPDRTPE
jgi:hypothetical protein